VHHVRENLAEACSDVEGEAVRDLSST